MLEVSFVINHFLYFYQNIYSSAGECLSIDHDNQLIILSFSVFNQECEQDFKYLNKHCTLSLPEGRVIGQLVTQNLRYFLDGHEITEALYLQYEKKQQKEVAIEFLKGDCIFVQATAWKNSSYRNYWPYDIAISNAYFEAHIESVLKGNKFQILFSAFEMDPGCFEYSR